MKLLTSQLPKKVFRGHLRSLEASGWVDATVYFFALIDEIFENNFGYLRLSIFWSNWRDFRLVSESNEE